jgi:hypothetical protein
LIFRLLQMRHPLLDFVCLRRETAGTVDVDCGVVVVELEPGTPGEGSGKVSAD